MNEPKYTNTYKHRYSHIWHDDALTYNASISEETKKEKKLKATSNIQTHRD